MLQRPVSLVLDQSQYLLTGMTMLKLAVKEEGDSYFSRIYNYFIPQTILPESSIS